MLRMIAAAILFAASLSGCQAPTEKARNDAMQGAARALEAFGALPQDRAAHADSAAPAASSGDQAKAARELLARIDRYAESERSGAPAIAAWFALYDDYRKLPPDQAKAVADPRTGEFLSVTSLVAVLPGPADWPALRDEARRRAARNVKNADDHATASALVLLCDALLNDADAQAKTLEELRRAASTASAQRREHSLPLIEEWRRYLADEARIAQSAQVAVSNPADDAPSLAVGAESTSITASPHADPESAAEVAATAERLKRALSAPPEAAPSDSPNSGSTFERAVAALKLARLGVREKRDDWLQQGSAQALKTLADTRGAAYDAKGSDRDSSDRDRVLVDATSVLRDAGLPAKAEQLLFDEIAAICATCRTMTPRECHDRFVNPYSGTGDLAPRLLLALYAGLGRDADVRAFIDGYPLWLHDDAAKLSVAFGCCDVQQPGVAIARMLVASGEKEHAARLLKALVAQPQGASPEAARLYGKIAGDEAVGAVLLMRQHAAGPRNAIAALAATGSGLWPRAQELAIAARREQLYAPWRAAMDDVLAGAADAANDAAAATRWRAAMQAQALAADARRDHALGLVAKAGEAYTQALASAQPGDCIENPMLTLARTRKDTAQAATLLRRMSDNARSDASGGGIGCLKEYLSLTSEEFATLRSALLGTGTGAVTAFTEDLPMLLLALDQDCNLTSRAELQRVCVEPAQLQRDARAAYAGIKSHLRPWDIDLVEILDDMVRRSAFPSLYAGHLDMPPKPPVFEANAFERDAWPVRLVKLDPTALPSAVERSGGGSGSGSGSYWRPVSHLVDYWFFAHGAAARLEPERIEPAYPPQVASKFGLREQSAANDELAKLETARTPPRDPAVRANLLVASTEIVQMAIRLIEPGRHDPCTTCL